MKAKPTARELNFAFSDMCNAHKSCCEKCPLYIIEEGLLCEFVFAHDVLMGDRNLDGTLVSESREGPVKHTLLKWCKVGQWVTTNIDDGIGKIINVDNLDIEVDFSGSITHFNPQTTLLKPVRFREYRTMREVQEVKGKWIAWEDVTASPPSHNESAITSLCERDQQIEIEGQRIEFWKSVNATIDGMPIGVPEIDDAMKEDV